MQVLPTPIPKSFKITDQYVWLPDLYTLPAEISFDVTCGSKTDEFLPCFSFTKAEWASESCDALSWYASPHRDDFTFRTDLFRNFPKVKRLSPPFKPAVGTKFTMVCNIDSTSATYSINGKPYAKATYDNGVVPIQGYFGFAKFKTENITVENVSVKAKSVLPPASNADKRILVNALVNMLEILGVLLSGQTSIITKVKKSEAETMIKKAIIAYRQTPSLNKLSIDKVHTAIDRVYDKVNSDVTDFFNEEIAEESLAAAAQLAFAAGSIFSFFPLISVICDGVSLGAMAAALGIEIDLKKKGPKIVTEANSLRSLVDQEPELAAAKVWADARSAELLTLGRLNAGMSSYRGDSSLYALIYVIDVKTPGLNDAQLFNAVKTLCMNVNSLASEVPNLGDKLWAVVSAENPTEIKKATEALTEISVGAAQLYAAIAVTVVFGAKLSYNVYKNFKSIKASWAEIEGTEIEEEIEDQWTKTMKTVNKISRGVAAVVGVFAASLEIWQAITTTKQKNAALNALARTRDSIKQYYNSVLSHVH